MTIDYEPLCTISYNVLKCAGWPRPEGTRLAFAPETYAEALAQYAPDIVTFSEAPPEPRVRTIARRLGMNHVYFPTSRPPMDIRTPETQWPGALMTRLEILRYENCAISDGWDASELFTRHWGSATLRRSDGEIVTVHSVHLHPRDEEIRAHEVEEVLAAIEPALQAGRSVLLQGDLNHTPDDPEYERWTTAGLLDSFAAAGDGDGFTFHSTQPSVRIDYVFAGGPLAERIEQSRPLSDGRFASPAAGDRRPELRVLSDHLPQLATFR